MKVRNKGKLANDSGVLSAYRPAPLVKPQGLISRVVGTVQRFLKKPPQAKTTEQGSGIASVLTAYQALWAQRWERQQYVADCELLLLEDPRMRRSYLKYVNEACRGGFKFKIDSSTGIGKKALDLAPKIEKMMTTQLMEGMGMRLMKTGDLFAQAVVFNDHVVACKPMPTVGMERLSDDADEIIDPNRAFAQVDITTWQDLCSWPTGLMCHVRWNHDPGSRYGIPEPLASRRQWRLLKLAEESVVVGRMTRAYTSKRINIGTAEDRGTQEDIDAWKAENGYVEGKREIFDPVEVARDYIGDGSLDITVLEGNPHQHEIEDVLHLQDALLSSSPTPGAIYGLQSKDINRDVLEDQRSEWLKDTRHINDAMDEVIRFIFDLELMLNGIDPELVNYSIVWTTSSVERPAEHIRSIIDTYQAGLASRRTALMKLRQYTEFEDIETELTMIEEEAPLRETPWKDGNRPSAEKSPAMKQTASPGTNGKVTPGPAGDRYDSLLHN